MRATSKERREMMAHLVDRLGISYKDAVSLRRISMTLHRWHELECGDGNNHASWAIERDDETGIPYMVRHPHHGVSSRQRIPDRETGARKRLAQIMQRYPQWEAYVQTDPRGAALYLVRLEDVGGDISSTYTRGHAVY